MPVPHMDRKIQEFGKFLGGPVLGLHAFTAKGLNSIPGWGTKILQGAEPGKKKKRKKERKEFSLFNFSFFACHMYLKMRHEHTVPGAFLLF